MAESSFSDQVVAFAQAKSMPALPEVIDVRAVTPENPPEEIQLKFVGLSYENAYAEAETFVRVTDEFAAKHGKGGFASLNRIVDFGSGWGRITRTLLTKVPAQRVHAIDVDDQMTALLNVTLPGVNALTIAPEPPTVLGEAAIDAAIAFSVFSHLSGPAHEAWAAEFGRIIAPGGVVAITVLDSAFFAQIAGAQAAVAAGEADGFATSLASTFDDLPAAQAAFKAGQIQYASSGGGEMRTGDYYGWAAAPTQYVERIWGAAGFRIVEWVPSGVLFPQALVFMVRGATGPHRLPSAPSVAVAQAGATVARRLRPLAGRVKRAIQNRR